MKFSMTGQENGDLFNRYCMGQLYLDSNCSVVSTKPIRNKLICTHLFYILLNDFANKFRCDSITLSLLNLINTSY
jgi:hypothetical protein